MNFDPTISYGTLLSAATMLIGFVGAVVVFLVKSKTIEEKVGHLETAVGGLESAVQGMALVQQQQYQDGEKLSDHEMRIRVLEQTTERRK